MRAPYVFRRHRDSPISLVSHCLRFSYSSFQLLEFYGNTERAQEVLVDYAAKNVANINAHKYLYHFCLRHGGDREEKIEALQVTMVYRVQTSTRPVEYGRMPDSQSREPGFKYPLLPFRSLGIFLHICRHHKICHMCP